jgi:hypothetical protein
MSFYSNRDLIPVAIAIADGHYKGYLYHPKGSNFSTGQTKYKYPNSLMLERWAKAEIKDLSYLDVSS